MTLDIRIEALPTDRDLAAEWRAVESRTPHSFFQSWTWLGSWIRALPDPAQLRLVRLRSAGETVGLGLLARRTFRRRRILRVHGAFLSETGDASLDSLTVEHNALLLPERNQAEGMHALVRELAASDPPIDELRVSGMNAQIARLLEGAAPPRGFKQFTIEEKPYFTVDLARLRSEGREYGSVLSANTRSQIRRSIREYQKAGPLGLRFARTDGEARSFLAELRQLHQAYWKSRGMPGAFATRFANRFHENLIQEGMQSGEVQLAEISCAAKPFAYLYNLVQNGVVMNYQAGIRYDSSPHLKPGLVAHQMVIEENLRRGAAIYDFLMGDQRYKRSLAMDQGIMCSLIVQRRSPRFTAERIAARLYRLLRRQAQRAASGF